MPTGEPIAEMILQNIETVLKTLVAGTDYYTTVQPENVERVERNALEITSFPHILIWPGRTMYDADPLERRVNQVITTLMLVEISISMTTRATTAQRDLQRFVRDVHRALLLDHTRGGNAMDSRILQSEPFYTNDERGPLSWADLVFEIKYRTPRQDLNALR